MNSEQINSLIRTGLKFLAGLLAAHGLTNAAGIINAPDITALIMLAVTTILSHFSHTTPTNTSNGGNGGKTTLLLMLLLPAMLLAGCAGLNANTFAAEQSAAATSDAAMRAYSVYWAKAEANPTAFHRTLPALDAERAKVEATAIQIGSSIELVENLRSAYQTNSAVQPQLQAALTTLAQNAGYIVILVNGFTSPTNNVQ